MSIENLINRAFTIEEKAVRKVRTVEGSRMYGQPIGTIITRDMIERAKRKRAREKAKNKRNSDSASDRNSDAPSSSGTSKRKSSEIEKEIADVQKEIDKLKAKPDTGVESTRKRRERLIAKAEERIKELQGSLGESSNSKKIFATGIKKGDKILDEGKWKTVERTDNWKGRQKVWFTDDTQTSFGHNEKASLWMDDDEADEHQKRVNEAEAKRKKDEDEKAKAEQKKKEDYERLSRTGAQLKPGDVMNNGSENGVVISRIEKEGDKGVRVFFEDGTMPKGLKLGNDSIVMLKATAEENGKGGGKDGGKDGGSTSEPEFEERQAKFIKEGDLVRHKGEWKKVKSAEVHYGKGKTTLSFEGEDGELTVASDRAFEVQYPGGKKPAKGAPKEKRKPGTSLFAGYKKPSEPKPADNKPNLKTKRASEIKVGDTFYDSDGEKHIAKEVEIQGGSVSIRTEGGSSFFMPDWESLYIEDTDPDEDADFDLTVPEGASKAEIDEWNETVDAHEAFRKLETDGDPVKEAKKKDVLKYSRQAIDRLRKRIEEQVAGREDSRKPAGSNAPTTSYAEGGDVYIEPRPLTGDEVTKRSEEYEERVVKEVAEWREYSKMIASNPAFGKMTSLDEIAGLEAFDGNKIPKSASDLKWKDSPKNKNFEMAQWGGITLVRDKENGHYEFRFGTQNVAVKPQSTYDVQDYSLKDKGYKLKPNAFEVLAKDHNIKKFLKEEPPKRVKRSDVPFWDYWNGIRGMDWMNEGETEADYDALVDRRLKAKEETARLGVNIGTGMNVEMHEVVNSVLDTYKERYPGLLATIDTFAIDNDPGAIAWLGSARPMRGVPQTKKALVMGLGPGGYGNSNEEVNNFWKNENRSWEFSGFKVGGNRVDLAEKIGLTPAHLSAMYTFNHEMGHAIGHLIMGQTNMGGRFAGLRFESPAKAKERMERYNERLTPILRKYGVLVKEDAEIKDYIDVSNYGETGNTKLLEKVSIFNKTKLSAHLSGYGAYNWHEIMAESWASYSMDENPTQFSLEMGEAMEELLLELMDEFGYGDEQEEKGISLRDTLMNKLYALSDN